MKNSARGEFVEPCGLRVSVVTKGSNIAPRISLELISNKFLRLGC